ncbi:hypothetical protein ASF08_09875 [Methylobacterium sp. Leaf85]|nr:hypothetical protein ASF08_09875 [Methylobacterium sp. Leaf85]
MPGAERRRAVASSGEIGLVRGHVAAGLALIDDQDARRRAQEGGGLLGRDRLLEAVKTEWVYWNSSFMASVPARETE